MKQLILSALAICICVISNAQNGNQPQKVEIEDENVTYSNDRIDQDDYTHEDYQRKVDELQAKIDWVKSNPEEDSLAQANGWYDKAYEALSKAKYELYTYEIKYDLFVDDRPELIDTGNPQKDKETHKAKMDAWIKNNPIKYKALLEYR